MIATLCYFYTGGGGGGGGEFINLFVLMILAIVTSRSVKRGILLSQFENGAGDAVGC